jgi:nitronate monooxygenase
MLRTKFCELVGIELPIVSAGMGGVALASLAAAVSEAGGLGTIALAGFSPEAIHNEISAARKLTSKPIAVNLLIPFLRPGVFEMLAKEPISAVTLFWGEPAEHIPTCKNLGLKVIWQCGSAKQARAAKDAGADAIIAQGVEAGGHVHGVASTFALVPEVRDAIGELPMLAAGGIGDGRGLAAALALGADGCVFGTRLLASRESAAHPDYKRALLAAQASDTMLTTLFDIGWPDAPHRVLRTALVREWEDAGRPLPGKRPHEGITNARFKRTDIDVPLVNYSVMAPSDFIEGDIGGLALYAGQSVNFVRKVELAGDIVREIAADAREAIADRLTPLTH